MVVARTRTQEAPRWPTLPQLPYAFDTLEPHIDARTSEIRSRRHHEA